MNSNNNNEFMIIYLQVPSLGQQVFVKVAVHKQNVIQALRGLPRLAPRVLGCITGAVCGGIGVDVAGNIGILRGRTTAAK